MSMSIGRRIEFTRITTPVYKYKATVSPCKNEISDWLRIPIIIEGVIRKIERSINAVKLAIVLSHAMQRFRRKPTQSMSV